ncbi:MAG TPA: DUF6209 family protein [Polyangia bacterium]|jgi:hypothetical protein
MKRGAWLSLLLIGACSGGVVDGGARSARAPFTTDSAGSEDAGDVDVADRECRVVLRRADFLADRSTGIVATIDVANGLLADPGATPGVLFDADGAGWQEVDAQPAGDGAAPAGFTRFVARFQLLAAADFIAFARTTTGVRLFDHNRLPGDFDSFHVDASNGFSIGDAPAVCPGPGPLGTVSFAGGWTQAQHGALVAGGQLSVEYDLGRLTACRGSEDGHRLWSLDAFAQFAPSGSIATGSVVMTTMAGDVAAPFVTDIPAGSTSVALWFENAGPSPPCQAWDSNYGANYVFAVVAAPTPAIGWMSAVGGSTDRACTHADTLEDPIVIDEYARERACLFADVDLWIGGVTDGSPAHPEYVAAEVEWSKDGGAVADDWIDDVGRVGNNERFRWQLPYELRNMADWTTAKYALRFSVDGRTWTYAEGGVQRTITRAFTLPSN